MNAVKTFTLLLSGLFFLRVAGPCNCKKKLCERPPRTATPGIRFALKDKITGRSLIQYTGTAAPAPDSIRLRDLTTGLNYPLSTGYMFNDTLLIGYSFARPSDITDTLVFSFGSAVPDTLIVTTGMVNVYENDECGEMKEPGITKVLLRGQVLLQTSSDHLSFQIRK